MPLFDLYPIETTSTMIERKRIEWVLSTQTTSSLHKATFYGNFINCNVNVPHQSFTRVSVDNNIRGSHMNSEIDNSHSDYDLYVPLITKKTFKIKGRLKSVSKLQITPSID